MKPFDIFVAYVSCDGGGKDRPVLAFILDDDTDKFLLLEFLNNLI